MMLLPKAKRSTARNQWSVLVTPQCEISLMTRRCEISVGDPMVWDQCWWPDGVRGQKSGRHQLNDLSQLMPHSHTLTVKPILFYKHSQCSQCKPLQHCKVRGCHLVPTHSHAPLSNTFSSEPFPEAILQLVHIGLESLGVWSKANGAEIYLLKIN